MGQFYVGARVQVKMGCESATIYEHAYNRFDPEQRMGWKLDYDSIGKGSAVFFDDELEFI